MSMADMIDERLVSFGLDVTNKEDAIRKICKMMYDAGKVSSYEDYLQGVKDRELEFETGMGNGIAIPHCKGGINMSLITLKNVKKEYGKNQVLFENLSLEIEKGEFVGLVGKSGAGKTTLLNIIGLITDISEGTIIIDSHQNLSMNSKNAMILRRYTIGYLFQNYGLIEDESVLWNLKLALEYKKIKKEEKLKLINKYLKQFELNDMLNKKVYQLSGGEQQRIAIIKLILQGSQVILADEPTSGLDKENELIVMKLLKELNEKGITIIMVTHNMNLCDCFSRVINVENFR